MKHPLEPTIKDGVEYYGGWIFTEKDLHSIEGNLMAIIEGIGLLSKQEDAIKSQVRQTLYRPTRYALYMGSDEVAKMGKYKVEKPDNEDPVALQHVGSDN